LPTEFRPSNSQHHLATQTAYRLLMSESHSGAPMLKGTKAQVQRFY
jgi:hypothetical protein